MVPGFGCTSSLHSAHPRGRIPWRAGEKNRTTTTTTTKDKVDIKSGALRKEILKKHIDLKK